MGIREAVAARGREVGAREAGPARGRERSSGADPAPASDLAASDIGEYLRRHERKSLLRFITCGSVDDGKSTLIGRLLYDAKALFEDQLAAIEADSRRWGTQGGSLDLALLVDGLAAEREQGITIDVAYRFFSTDRRQFIVADTPGHEQYTRNMVTGASTADLAVILVDARKGLLTQTRRHSVLVQLLGIRQVVLAVNKMDLVGWDEGVFDAIDADYRTFAARIGIPSVTSIPLSALRGDNVAARSAAARWYRGPSLVECLEAAEVDHTRLERAPLRLPVQWVNRPHADFRGFAGLIAAGTLRPGDRVRVQPSGRETQVARIVAPGGDRALAVAGESVTITLADEVDVSRGDLIAAADAPAEVADRFDCTLVWMAESPLEPGRPYLAKIGPRTVGATIAEPRHRLDVDTLAQHPARRLGLNEIGACTLVLDRAVPFDPYRDNRDTGGFIVVDRLSNDTVAAGMLQRAVRGAPDVRPQRLAVDPAERAALTRQRPAVLWFTGISGAGKSTIANRVDRALLARRRHAVLLDGDNLRHGLCADLGFTAADRAENVRRTAEVARLMADAGLVVLVALISPFRAERAHARARLGDGAFIEIHVDTPLAAAEARDVKGLYAKARRGELRDFTGIDSPYEPPEAPELRIDTATTGADEAAERIVALLVARGIVD